MLVSSIINNLQTQLDQVSSQTSLAHEAGTTALGLTVRQEQSITSLRLRVNEKHARAHADRLRSQADHAEAEAFHGDMEAALIRCRPTPQRRSASIAPQLPPLKTRLWILMKSKPTTKHGLPRRKLPPSVLTRGRPSPGRLALSPPPSSVVGSIPDRNIDPDPVCDDGAQPREASTEPRPCHTVASSPMERVELRLTRTTQRKQPHTIRLDPLAMRTRRRQPPLRPPPPLWTTPAPSQGEPGPAAWRPASLLPWPSSTPGAQPATPHIESECSSHPRMGATATGSVKPPPPPRPHRTYEQTLDRGPHRLDKCPLGHPTRYVVACSHSTY